MGAISLVNVIRRPAVASPSSAAAIAVNETSMAPLIRNLRRLALRATIGASFYGDLYFGIGPTAVIPEISGNFTGTVVDYGLKNIFTGFAEAGGRDGFPVDDGGLAGSEDYHARSAIFPPDDGHTDGLAGFLRQTVVGGGHGQRGLAGGCDDLLTRFDPDHGRGVRVDLFAIAAARGSQ